MKKITDKMRLDFIIKEQAEVSPGIMHPWRCMKLADAVPGFVFYGNTPRLAIDAAIRAKGAGR